MQKRCLFFFRTRKAALATYRMLKKFFFSNHKKNFGGVTSQAEKVFKEA
ncbi:hypothetical protein J32TS6_17740 [Virgibacillus pantothenticus]|nr:hypothetical protein [Virgibacillus pantothenticus]MBU8567801.1 hypothetical protein [Virgibacillus pantothenticus]MBU8601594.1 hypothetical protein [Virgibacillus pantothenticus]MBU8635823.1 hypothetical protein [Virgibacillus pantothenticus]MBU8643529.1 hypothetical protein [Virgibacillus pantothenticus]MBU8647601.1 hypothetical protein [Virgibacillus pantothenticus]